MTVSFFVQHDALLSAVRSLAQALIDIVASSASPPDRTELYEWKE